MKRRLLMGNSFLPLSLCCHGACAYFLFYSLLSLCPFDLFCSRCSPNPSPTTTILESFWLFLCPTKPGNRPLNMTRFLLNFPKPSPNPTLFVALVALTPKLSTYYPFSDLKHVYVEAWDSHPHIKIWRFFVKNNNINNISHGMRCCYRKITHSIYQKRFANQCSLFIKIINFKILKLIY